MFSTIRDTDRPRRTKTNIVRTRTGCQNCRKRRRKCDEGRPECQGCVKRGIKCSGYERTIAFKDVSGLAAESSRKFEAARWAAIRVEDEQLGRSSSSRKRRRASGGSSPEDSASRVETLSSSDGGSEHEGDGERSSSSSTGRRPTVVGSKVASPRQYRRAQNGLLQPETSSFEGIVNREEPPVDPALWDSPLPFYQSPDFGHLASVDLGGMEDSPPADASHETSTASTLVATDATTASTVDNTTTTTSLTPHPHPPSLPSLPPSSPLPCLRISFSPAHEASLLDHFQSHLLPSLPVPLSISPSHLSNLCLRHAILALSSVNRAYLSSRTTLSLPSSWSTASSALSVPGKDAWSRVCIKGSSAVGREHYLVAVRELYTLLDLSSAEAREQHAMAALMLAYYEIETGSPFGSLRHARGLDALLSKLDLSSSSSRGGVGGGVLPSAMPEIFKAWRVLRYDVRSMAAPYRASAIQIDQHDAYAGLDPQLNIRDVYTLLWNLVGRLVWEASFTPDPVKGSRARQVAVWIRDTAGRVCDTRNVEKGDVHDTELDMGEVLEMLDRMSRRLDGWHAGLGVEGRPCITAGEGKPFVLPQGDGAAFEPITVVGFAQEGKAFEYVMYLASRLLVSYALSVHGEAARAPQRQKETQAWANMLFGVVCGMRYQNMMFSYVDPVNNLVVAAQLCEGMGALNAVLEGVIPYVLGKGLPVAELASWFYLKKALEIVRRERVRGRNVRSMLITLDEDYEKGLFDTECSFLGFGDYNGRGHFRDVYAMDAS